MKRAILAILLLLSLQLAPGAAQPSLLDWIPADFEGFLRVEMSNPAESLQRLNIAVFVGTIFQPTRLAIDSALRYDDFFPLTALDVENISFNTAVLPWLKDELIVAYRALPPDYRASEEDVLLILPVDDPFDATSGLSNVIQQQDLLEQTSYRGVTIYNGDRISLAITPLAVLIGAEETIRAVLDTAQGETDALTADATYQGVRAAIREDLPVFAYLRSGAAANGLAYLLSGGGEASSLYVAVGEALSALSEVETVESALLSGEIDGLGIGLQLGNAFSTTVGATAIFHTTGSDLAESDAGFDPIVLEYVPRSALLVQSGADVLRAVYASLVALPMSSFAGQVLGGFPVASTAPPDALLPTAADLTAAVTGLAGALDSVNDIQLFEDVIGKLQGSYSFALLPRPNNPLPVLNSPFDAMFVAQVDDGEAVMEDLISILRAFVGEDNVEVETVDGQTSAALVVPETGEALLWLMLDDGTLLIATGDSVEAALNARRGDNRLISQPRWEALSAEVRPDFYLDIPAFYTTFFPAAASQVASSMRQVGVYSRSLGDGLYEVRLEAVLPAM